MRRSLFLLVLGAAALAPASASALEAPGRVAVSVASRVPVGNVDAGGAAAGVALPDGGAVLAGGQYGALDLARLDAGGHLTASFGEGGTAHPEVPGGLRPSQVLLRPDSGLLLVGSSPVNPRPPEVEHVAVLALTANGAVDGTYGDGGLAVSPAHAIASPAAALAPDGSLLMTGGAIDASAPSDGPPRDGPPRARGWVVARLTPAGRPDPSFGTGGAVTLPVDVGTYDGGSSVAPGPAGRILTLGRVNGGFQLWALDPSGAVDPGYHGGAPVRIADATASEALYRADGGVDVVSAYLIRRFLPNGEPGLAYGRAGRADLAGIYTSSTPPLALGQPDGGIVLAQTTALDVHPTSVGDAYVFRIAPNGVRGAVLPFRLGFGGGVAGGPTFTSSFALASLVPRADGGVLVAGGTRIAAYTGEGEGFSTGFFSAAAFTSALAPDGSYGGPGRRPEVSLRIPRQRVRVVRALRRVVVRVRVGAPGLLLLRVRDGKRRVIAQEVTPVYAAGTVTARVRVTRRGRDVLGAHLGSGLSVGVGHAFRDVLTQRSQGVERVRLR